MFRLNRFKKCVTFQLLNHVKFYILRVYHILYVCQDDSQYLLQVVFFFQ